MKSKTHKPSRPSAMPPNLPAPLRAHGGPTTIVPTSPLKDAGFDQNTAIGAAKSAKPDREAGCDDDGNPLKKQELISLVVARSDVAKKYAKPVIEAMLAVLGDALAEDRDLNLQPMGKIKRKRIKETEKARIIVANIRQSKAIGAGSGPGDTGAAKPLPGSTPGGAIAPAMDLAANPAKEAVADNGEGR